MLLFLVQSLLAFGTDGALAEVNIRGHLLRQSGQTKIMTEDLQVYGLHAGTIDVADDLMGLESGDFLAGHGDLTDGVFVLEGVEFIGLRRILGRWLDQEDKVIFNFQDYGRAVVKSTVQKTQKQLQYVLVPEDRKSWTIFLGDLKTVMIGTLTLSGKSMKIDLLNSKTGELQKRIRLKQLAN
jgi:hypothetical protein